MSIKENTRWYPSLVPDKNKPEGKPLLANEQQTADDVLVCQELLERKRGSKRQFGLIPRIDFVRRYRIDIKEKHRTFYEVIQGYAPHKLYFDFDFDFEKGCDVEKTETHIAVNQAKLAIQRVTARVRETDIIVCSSHESLESDKHSYHIIVDNWKVANNEEAREYARRVHAQLSPLYQKHLDMSMYSKNQQFRMYGCHKYWKDDRVKTINTDLCNWNPQFKPKDAEHLEELRALACMVTNASYCRMLPRIVLEDKKEEKTYAESPDIESEEVPEVMKLFAKRKPDMAKAFQYNKTNGNIISLMRTNTGPCDLCDRDHDNENAFLSIVGEERKVYYGCFRNSNPDKRSIYIGKAQIKRVSVKAEEEAAHPITIESVRAGLGRRRFPKEDDDLPKKKSKEEESPKKKAKEEHAEMLSRVTQNAKGVTLARPARAAAASPPIRLVESDDDKPARNKKDVKPSIADLIDGQPDELQELVIALYVLGSEDTSLYFKDLVKDYVRWDTCDGDVCYICDIETGLWKVGKSEDVKPLFRQFIYPVIDKWKAYAKKEKNDELYGYLMHRLTGLKVQKHRKQTIEEMRPFLKDPKFGRTLNKTKLAEEAIPLPGGKVFHARTNKIVDLTPEYRFTYTLEASPDPSKGYARVEDFVRKVTLSHICKWSEEEQAKLPDHVREQIPEREQLYLFVQMILGYALLGVNHWKWFFFFVGTKGDNAKSTLMRLVQMVAGQCYGAGHNQDLFTQRQKGYQGHSDTIASIKNFRIVVWTEPEADSPVNMEFIRQQVGDDVNMASKKGKSNEQIEFTHTGFALTNSPPTLSSEESCREKIKVVPFDARFLTEQQKEKKLAAGDITEEDLLWRIFDKDPTWKGQMMTDESFKVEMANWLLEGAHRALTQQQVAPKMVEASTEHTIQTSNRMFEFIDERLRVTKELYKRFWPHKPLPKKRTADNPGGYKYVRPREDDSVKDVSQQRMGSGALLKLYTDWRLDKIKERNAKKIQPLDNNTFSGVFATLTGVKRDMVGHNPVFWGFQPR